MTSNPHTQGGRRLTPMLLLGFNREQGMPPQPCMASHVAAQRPNTLQTPWPPSTARHHDIFGACAASTLETATPHTRGLLGAGAPGRIAVCPRAWARRPARRPRGAARARARPARPGRPRAAARRGPLTPCARPPRPGPGRLAAQGVWLERASVPEAPVMALICSHPKHYRQGSGKHFVLFLSVVQLPGRMYVGRTACVPCQCKCLDIQFDFSSSIRLLQCPEPGLPAGCSSLSADQML